MTGKGFAAALVLIAALAAAGGAQARPLAQCAAKVGCPDLYVNPKLVGTPQLSTDQTTVTVSATVRNQGTADSAATTVDVSAPGWTTASAPLRALKAGGDQQQVTASLQVPDSARGKQASFLVQVDPNDTVDETNETNNQVSTRSIFIPAGDLQVTLDSSALADAGKTLVLKATVSNAGRGPTAATVLAVAGPASSTWSGSADVPALDAGGSAAVDLSLPIPDKARGRTWPLSLVVDPDRNISETSYENNVSGTLDVSIDAGDLTVEIVGAGAASDRGSVSFTARVTNAGRAPTAPTTVQAQASGSSARASDVGSLAAGASADVPVTLALAPSAAGTTVLVQATVDPAHDVAESDYGDNAAQPVSVVVPATRSTTTNPTTTTTPKKGPPNLVVRIVRASVRGDPVLIAALAVLNSGGERSDPTRVALFLAGLSLAPVQVPAIAAGRSVRLSIRRTVPAERGARLSLSAVVDPLHDVRESSYADNASAPLSLAFNPPRPSPSWPKWVGAGAAIALVLLGPGYGAARIRFSLRVRWQGEAHDEEPPERCRAPETYVWRRNCKAKPALRGIEEVVFLCSRDGRELERKADEKLVEGLNRAVKTRRSLVLRRRLERQMELLADDLCGQVGDWLASDAREQVAIRASLKGGKLECEFRRYRCVCAGPTCSWRERQKWTGELEVETEEPVTVLTLPLPTRSDERAQALTLLQAELLAFVKRVDVPRRERPPETAPIAH